jgi:tRNA-dihydrouridine synthase
LNPFSFDINAGCPDKNIVKSGCGGALLRTPEKIIDIVTACKDATNLPISIKTRAGYDNLDDIFDLAPKLIAVGIAMLTVHPRTVKQGYTGAADWGVIRKLKSSYLPPLTSTLIVGSGDVNSWQEALERQQETLCDGVMIGRGALGKPWIFEEIKNRKNHPQSEDEIRSLVIDLAEKADDIWGDVGIRESRKHFAWYCKEFDGAKDLRTRLMQVSSLADVKKTLDT